MKIGYARVSREEQNPALQRDALAAAGCVQIFEDRMTGADFRRKGLRRALSMLKPGGELVVWKLDRLGRSMLETISVVLDLDRRGIGFRSLTESFDTKTPIGRGVLAIIAAVAEDERERIRERTKAGMQAAKKRGARIGAAQTIGGADRACARHDRRTRIIICAGSRPPKWEDALAHGMDEVHIHYLHGERARLDLETAIRREHPTPLNEQIPAMQAMGLFGAFAREPAPANYLAPFAFAPPVNAMARCREEPARHSAIVNALMGTRTDEPPLFSDPGNPVSGLLPEPPRNAMLAALLQKR